MKEFPDNQIKYLVKQKWNTSNKLESAITDCYYFEKKGAVPTKTDDIILLYVLGINKKEKKAFSVKFDAWKNSKDSGLTNELLKLFFLSSLRNESYLKKETIRFIQSTQLSDFNEELSSLYLFLEEIYLNKDNHFVTKGKKSVLNLISCLYSFYKKNDVKNFYETQILLIDLVNENTLNTYEKVGLLLYSEDKQFQGIQLNRRDSVEYLKNNNPPVFYNYIKTKYFSALKTKWWFFLQSLVYLQH